MDSKDCKKLIKWIKSSRYLATFTTDSIYYYTTCRKASPQGGWFFLKVDGDKITVFSKNNDLEKIKVVLALILEVVNTIQLTNPLTQPSRLLHLNV